MFIVGDKKDQKKLIELLAMCYINMGDLCRYMKDIFAKPTPSAGFEINGSDYFYQAQEWYTQVRIIIIELPRDGQRVIQLMNFMVFIFFALYVGLHNESNGGTVIKSTWKYLL